MNILWVNWKDWRHPGAGGAEVVLHELIKRQVADGHNVTLLTALYKDAKPIEQCEGLTIIRVPGNRYIQPFTTARHYRKHLRGQHDVIIEAVNTAPYFMPYLTSHRWCGLSPRKRLAARKRPPATDTTVCRWCSKTIAQPLVLYHQLARQVWFHELPPPFGLLGYALIEPASTFLMAKSGTPTIAMSNSTKQDLKRFGFREQQLHIISEGIESEPLRSLDGITKYEQPTLFAHGAMRAMKRTLHQIQAFELAKPHIPDLRIMVSGNHNGPYGKKVLDYIAASPYAADIHVLGRTTTQKRDELMQRSHLHLQTAAKEGWGITVTEANASGTPCVVYDTDGLRDSVRNGETGIITASNPQSMANAIVQLLQDQDAYEKLRQNAWRWSHDITFDQSYRDLLAVLRHITQ
ncbi:hypothetical protein CR970_03015 [Candidatus Saccharibacteria bacterium]|nr:MAG: hypothetical protein CR970_03015 [Candidatus Saccharibacteria bacterium]